MSDLWKRHGALGNDDDEEEEKEEEPVQEAVELVPEETRNIPINMPVVAVAPAESTEDVPSISSGSSIAEGSICLAFGLVALAALFSILGSILGVFLAKKSVSKKLLAGCMGLSGGILVFLSLTDILGEARSEFRRRPNLVSRDHSTTISLALFLSGIVLYMTLKMLANLVFPQSHPKARDPEAVELEAEKSTDTVSESQHTAQEVDYEEEARFRRSAIEIAITLAIHNIPEGIILFTTTLASSSIGISLAIGLLFHKFPEGLVIAMPFYAGTKSSWKSVVLASMASSFFLFVGALLSYVVFTQYWNSFASGFVLSLTAGILFWLGITVTLPLAFEADRESRYVSAGILAGVTIVSLSSIILSY